MAADVKFRDKILVLCLAIHWLVQQVSEEQSYCKSVAKKQQQQQEDLRKLPRHHPLIREVHSDDGKHNIVFLFFILFNVKVAFCVP